MSLLTLDWGLHAGCTLSTPASDRAGLSMGFQKGAFVSNQPGGKLVTGYTALGQKTIILKKKTERKTLSVDINAAVKEAKPKPRPWPRLKRPFVPEINLPGPVPVKSQMSASFLLC